jgi:RHS repeat-associated protein
MALQIDDLHYTYADKSNRLLKVTDFENSSQGFADDSDGTNDTQDDYDYDGYGNMIQDQNKQIRRITYNHLNLPTVITFDIAGTNNITYLYDALGKKRRKTVKMTGDITKSTATEYLGGFQYVDGELQFFPTAQGYVRVVDGKYRYVYNMTDHLGNIRVSYTYNTDESKLEIMEENHYYPYGMKHQNYNISKLEYVPGDSGVVLASASALEFKYKFNGQEWQEELGLNTTAMDFRQYDNAIGRFTSIDALAELSYSITPFRFGFNNPIYWNDPTGLFESWFAALEYMRTNGLSGSIYEVGGVYHIKGEDGENGNSVGIFMEDGDLTHAMMHYPSSGSSEYKTPWFFMNDGFVTWGANRYGDLGGYKNGNKKNSIDTSQFPSFSSNRGRNIKLSNGFWTWLRNIITGSKDVAEIGQKADSIINNIENNNTSVEAQNIEAVAPPTQALESAVNTSVQQDTVSYILHYWQDGVPHGGSGYGKNAGRIRALERAKEEMKQFPFLDSIQVIRAY